MSAALQLLCLVSIGEKPPFDCSCVSLSPVLPRLNKKCSGLYHFHFITFTSSSSSSEVMLVRLKSDADAQGCAELEAMWSAQVSPLLGAPALSRCQLSSMIVTILIMLMIVIVIGLTTSDSINACSSGNPTSWLPSFYFIVLHFSLAVNCHHRSDHCFSVLYLSDVLLFFELRSEDLQVITDNQDQLLFHCFAFSLQSTENRRKIKS